jgi:hypothetical protein
MLVQNLVLKIVPDSLRIMTVCLLKVLEILGRHPSHNRIAELSRERNINGSRQVRDLRIEHICGNHCLMNLIAAFATIPRGIIMNLFAAIWACIIHHFIVGEDPLHETREFVELRFRGLITIPTTTLIQLCHIFSDTFNDFLDKLEIVRSLDLRIRSIG